MLKISLSINIGQHLTLTPQLQQAIRLLQLSTLELQQEIQQMLENNPMLELNEETVDESSMDKSPTAQEIVQPSEGTMADSGGGSSTEQIDLPVESDWQEEYISPISSSNQYSNDLPGFEATTSAETSLQDHLIWQMELTPFTARDSQIAEAIIDAINDDGMLTQTLEDIKGTLLEDENNPVELNEIEAVLHRVQCFDPLGVGARSLDECLLIQLHPLKEDTPHRETAKNILEKHMNLLASHDYQHIMRKCHIDKTELMGAINLIQSLNPRPGSLISPKHAEYIIPDVIVRKTNGCWKVELNSDITPKLRINDNYASLIKRADYTPDNNYLKENLQEARWFIKSLQSRNETLLKVASAIVEQQQNFLEYGEEAMKAMTLHDIAEKVEMHESTISRVTSQKYMYTQRGILELKYFFSSHVNTSNGGECSSTAIRALIKKLIAEEHHEKPLSDNKIAQILQSQGINIARRTVAKYREASTIPPSNERKSIIEK